MGTGDALADSAASQGQRAAILLHLGQIALDEGDLPEASALFDEAVEIVGEQGDWPYDAPTSSCTTRSWLCLGRC